MVHNNTEELTVMTDDFSTLAFAELEGRGRSDVPEEVAAHRGQLEARHSNQSLHHDSGSANLSSEMMAMTRALFSSLETRVSRLESSSSHQSNSDHALQNRLTSLESSTERQLKAVREASSETKESQERRITAVENDLSARITKLEQEGDLEERVSKLEEAVASLNASKLEQATQTKDLLSALQKKTEGVVFDEEEVLARLEKRLDERMEEWFGGTSSAKKATSTAPASANMVERTEDDKTVFELMELIGSLPRKKVAGSISLAAPQPDMSAFLPKTPVGLKDHRNYTLRRGKTGKLIAPHPKSPACLKVAEHLVFFFSKKLGGFLVHSSHDGNRLSLGTDGVLHFITASSVLPTSRELFFVIPNSDYLLFGCFHTQSLVVTKEELCHSKRMTMETIPQQARFRIIKNPGLF